MVHVHQRHPRRLARPRDANRWYDFLQLYVAKQAPITNSAVIRAAAPVVYEEAMGISPRDAAARPDPGGADVRLGARRVREAAAGPHPVRQRRRRLAARRAVPRLRAVVRELPARRGPSGRAWFFDANGGLGDAPPASAGADRFTWNTKARPMTDFTGDTAAGDGGLWTATPPYRWTQNPAGTAVSYVTAPLTREHDGARRRLRARLGQVVGQGRRPPGDDLRGPPRRQGGVRAGRLGPHARAQARPQEEHPARARPEPAQARLRAACPAAASPR